jgi:hypothetical protein
MFNAFFHVVNNSAKYYAEEDRPSASKFARFMKGIIALLSGEINLFKS